jgi:hypothetical protein
LPSKVMLPHPAVRSTSQIYRSTGRINNHTHAR